MDLEVIGGPDDGPTLRLDHERFAYAGKFVMSATGKAVACEDDAIVAAASFDRDRTDATTARIRYVTVRADRRGEGIGSRLLSFLAGRLLEEGADRPIDAERVLIAVNNAFAYEAAYKAGFCYTGERTGLAELVLTRPGDRSGEGYRRGIASLAARDDLGDDERSFLTERVGSEPPPTVDPATDV